MSCISSSNLSILINGESLDPFSPSRGIRYGDPLSSYIFILCMEYLAELIKTEVNQGNWIGMKMSREGPSFSHLFFADDLILFAKAIKKNCLTIKKVLADFCTSSSKKVNHNKSKIFFSPHICAENVFFIENKLGMNRTNIFDKYLNVPIITDG